MAEDWKVRDLQVKLQTANGKISRLETDLASDRWHLSAAMDRVAQLEEALRTVRPGLEVAWWSVVDTAVGESPRRAIYPTGSGG